MQIFSGSLFQGRVAESTMGDKWAVGSKQGSRDILYMFVIVHVDMKEQNYVVL